MKLRGLQIVLLDSYEVESFFKANVEFICPEEPLESFKQGLRRSTRCKVAQSSRHVPFKLRLKDGILVAHVVTDGISFRPVEEQHPSLRNLRRSCQGGWGVPAKEEQPASPIGSGRIDLVQRCSIRKTFGGNPNCELRLLPNHCEYLLCLVRDRARQLLLTDAVRDNDLHYSPGNRSSAWPRRCISGRRRSGGSTASILSIRTFIGTKTRGSSRYEPLERA